jgi:superfamily II DNA/RNA helicase
MSVTFQSLGLEPELIAVLSRQGITSPFPIQADAIPDTLSGRDIQGRAPTGSGKTLAFGLPLLSQIGRGTRRLPRALILVPTRELAEQIRRDLEPLARAVDRRVSAVFGGVAYGPQKKTLDRGVDVLVATPGRLEDLIEQGALDLSEVTLVVLDEADRMADMGFVPAVRRILSRTRRPRQTLLYSATLDGDVAVLSREEQRDPVHVVAEPKGGEKSDVVHHFWRVDHSDRVRHTAQIIDATGRTIVFTRTRHGADRLAKQLAREGVEAVAMHGGRSQSQRTRALSAFTNGEKSALIATDVAARGIHVEDVDVVVHFDPAGDHKDYTHRSGRTARAGARGAVVSLVSAGQEGEVRRLQKAVGLSTPIGEPKLDLLTSPRPRGTKPSGMPQVAAPVAGEATIYVGNLPWSTEAHDLIEMFADHGLVGGATIRRQKGTGRSKGYGFVDMPPGDAAIAIRALDGSLLAGRKIRVRAARPA